ncbi:AAA family ATPase [Saccharomonospora xinjiangensis]|uniref:Transcriptional regulator, luxR family n=1 Tax=Saccharomonospora xinjiangensis XJ-54 TaxID=882086 RepID=I0V5G5_9PSEU|nr:AAA family ATPase [Saccharomonospora xinjiangensis]EID55368.1 transcriptional regulator, luxR family [Saccharomonospora xinjiangensis XJ-54]
MPDQGAALDQLRSLLSDCRNGRGGFAVVTGGLGSGKTELLQRFADRAVEAGALVLSASGAWSEQSLQGGMLEQLVPGAGTPAEVASRLAGLIMSCAGSPTDHLPKAHLLHELCTTLLELSREQPVVVSIDDVQFADSLSQQFLLHLRRRVSSSRVLLVLGEWDHCHPLASLLHAEVNRRPACRIHLGPLSESGIATLLAKHTDSRTSAELAPLWRRWSGGNVMLVRAMLDDLVAGHVADDHNLGPSAVASVLSAVHRWEPSIPAVAQAMAVLGDDCSVDVVARLAEVSTEIAQQIVAFLGTSGLALGTRFRHPGARAAVLDSLSSAERSALHGRAAEVLYHRGDDASTVAAHLLALGRLDGGCARWSVDVLRVAAEQALSADDVDAAIRCLELALTSAEGPQHVEVSRMLVRAWWRVNPSASAAYLDPLRTALWDGALRGRDVVILLWHALWTGDHTTVERGLEECGKDPRKLDVQSAAELRILCRFHGVGAGSLGGTLEVRRDTDPWAEAGTALGQFWTSSFDRQAVAAAEHVLKSCRPGETVPEVVATALLVLSFAGDIGSAAHWCGRVIDEAVNGGVRTWQAFFEVVRAHLTLRRGDPATAFRLAESAMSLLPAQSWGVSIGYPTAVLLTALTELGDLPRLDELLRLPVPEAMFDNVVGLFYLHARGHAQLACGRVLAAISDFQHCGLRMEQRGSDLPLVAPWRLDLAEANLALGRRDAARDLVTQQLTRPSTDRWTRGVALRVLADLSAPRDREFLLTESVELLRAAGDGLALAKSQRHLDRLASGTSAPAEDLADTAVAREPQGEAAVASMLSDSERRVAELAAAGRTNREISALLYITVSTVEQHLTRVYRKLGVKGRAELPRELTSLGIHADVCGTGA